MHRLHWDSSLSVDIELIDQQHKEWIKHFNRVVESIESQEGASQIVKTLNFLIDYSEIHFSTEEKNMQANKYPGIQEHKNKHDELRCTLNNLISEFHEEGPTNLLIESMEALMNNWFAEHINETDKKFIDFIKQNSLKISE
jgi:hemerythrin